MVTFEFDFVQKLQTPRIIGILKLRNNDVTKYEHL